MTTKVKSAKPKHLKACPSCGSKHPHWKSIGKQVYPVRYAKLPSMALRLSDGKYTWSADRVEFGAELYDCSACGTTCLDI